VVIPLFLALPGYSRRKQARIANEFFIMLERRPLPP
jgi:hypothetical protein